MLKQKLALLGLVVAVTANGADVTSFQVTAGSIRTSAEDGTVHLDRGFRVLVPIGASVGFESMDLKVSPSGRVDRSPEVDMNAVRSG